MLAHSYLPQDDRIMREARALVEQGCEVDIICLKQPSQSWTETVDCVNMIRFPIQRNRTRGIFAYGIEYFGFTAAAAVMLWTRMIWRRYRVVHTHNPPDFLMWAMLPLKIFGVKAVLDLHDPGPEMAMSKWEISDSHPLVKLWKRFEHSAVRFADRLIVTNAVDQDIIQKRNGVPAERFFIVMNTPDLRGVKLADQNGQDRTNGKPVTLLYQGMVAKRRGVQTVLAALSQLRSAHGDVRLTVAGQGTYLEPLKQIASQQGLADCVHFAGHVDKQTLVELIQDADYCLIPFLNLPINARGVPNKLFEYMTIRKPIIAANLPGMRSVVNDEQIWFYEAGNADSLSETVSAMIKRPELVQSKMAHYQRLLEAFNWQQTAANLWNCYSSLGFREKIR